MPLRNYTLTHSLRRNSFSKCNPWLISTLRASKYTVSEDENIRKRNQCAHHYSSFKCICNRYNSIILANKNQYYSNLVSSSSENAQHIWQTINKLLHRNCSSALPTFTSANAVTYGFASSFTDKIYELHLSLWPVALYNNLHIHLFLQKHQMTYTLLSLLLNLKSIKSQTSVPTNNVIPILFLPGFLKNVLQSRLILLLT